MSSRRTKAVPVKFRVERDVLAEAVTWAARGLPARPPVPVLAGLLLRGRRRRRPAPLELRLRGLRPGQGRGRGRRPRHRPGLGRLLADISRTLPGRPVDVATDGSRVSLTCGATRFTLLTMPVEEYPTLPTMPERSGSIGRRLHPGRRPGDRRRRPRRHAADPHRGPDGDRRRHPHPARHRPLPPRHARAALEPDVPRRQPRRAGPGAHPVRHGALARRRAARSTSPWARPPVATS